MSTLGRFEELDALASVMTQRHHTGAVHLLYLALGSRLLGAQLQGKLDETSQHFTKPPMLRFQPAPRLHKAPEARAINDNGEPGRGVGVLRDHVEDLPDSDYTDAARLAAIAAVLWRAKPRGARGVWGKRLQPSGATAVTLRSGGTRRPWTNYRAWSRPSASDVEPTRHIPNSAGFMRVIGP